MASDNQLGGKYNTSGLLNTPIKQLISKIKNVSNQLNNTNSTYIGAIANSSPSYAGTPGYSYGGGGYGGGYGGGGGGNSAGDTVDFNIAIAKLGDKFGREAAEGANKIYDANEDQIRATQAYQLGQATQKAGNEWWKEYHNRANMFRHFGETMGNAAYGAMTPIRNQLVQSQYDQTNADILATLRNNMQSINTDTASAIQSGNNGLNEYMLDLGQKQAQMGMSHLADLFNSGKEYVNGENDDYQNVYNEKKKEAEIPDYIKTDYLDTYFRGPTNPEEVPLFREDAAFQNSVNKGMNNTPLSTRAAANKDYWKRMSQSYGQVRV